MGSGNSSTSGGYGKLFLSATVIVAIGASAYFLMNPGSGTPANNSGVSASGTPKSDGTSKSETGSSSKEEGKPNSANNNGSETPK